MQANVRLLLRRSSVGRPPQFFNDPLGAPVARRIIAFKKIALGVGWGVAAGFAISTLAIFAWKHVDRSIAPMQILKPSPAL
jgi:hypothetical protein